MIVGVCEEAQLKVLCAEIDSGNYMASTTKTSRASAPRKRVAQPRADSEQTRERILDSAEKLFAWHGFHGTSIRDIAIDADYQFALIGYHFGSKLDLMDRVVGRRSEVLNAERL